MAETARGAVPRALAAMMVGLVSGVPARAAGEAPPVETVRVGHRCFAHPIRATGTIVPHERAVVMFDTPDLRISDVLAAPGAMVARGDVLAQAVSTAPRAAGAGGAPAIAIRAPAASLILESAAVVGMPASGHDGPLFTLAVDGDMEALVDVPATQLFAIEAGQPVHVDLRDGTTVEGRVRVPPLTIDPASQMGQARIALQAARRPLPGRFVRVTIEAAASCGASIPRRAVLRNGGAARVRVVEGGVVVTRTVRLGPAGGVEVEAVAGLREGETIVADASLPLPDGTRLDPDRGGGVRRP